MREVLISIQPKWCGLIANGKKTVEVRKTRPKIETPFKVYIYCTQAKDVLAINDKLPYLMKKADVDRYNADTIRNGKVIGEFVCQTILKYECEFVDDDCYEDISCIGIDEDGSEIGFIEWSNDRDEPYEDTFLYKTSRVEYEELKKYIGLGFGTFYGWHISDLVIYDEPKELGEFINYDRCPYGGLIDCKKCEEHHCLKRPPQSRCYVEGGEQ